MDKPLTYQDAGVDIDKANRFVKTIREITKGAPRSGVIADIGGFSGLYSLDASQYKNPVLVSATDGVGTKLKVAHQMGKHDTIGIDLVAMCVNDIAAEGAKPLFFLDYLSMGTLVTEIAEAILHGIVTGCKLANCALIGGETAEMPGLYADGEYDLAGFAVGIEDNSKLVDGSQIAVGHKLIGIASSGLHSNGYSLVRKIFFEGLNMTVNDHVPDFGRTLGEELLEPTRIYARTISNLRRDFHIYAICHITGGGLIDNPPRMLPGRCKAVIDKSSWSRPAIFPYLQKAGQISEQEMMRTFNNGLGLLVVISQEDTSEVLLRLKAMGETAYLVGSVEERNEDEAPVQFVGK